MRSAAVLLWVLVGLGCIAETDALDGGEPIPLRLVELEPSCFVPPVQPLSLPPDGSSDGWALEQARVGLDFARAYAAQWTERLTVSIRSEPRARQWALRERESVTEAWVVEARPGSRYRLRAELRSEAAGVALGVDIETSPELTRYQLDEMGEPVTVWADHFSLGSALLGCDRKTATSFASAYALGDDGEAPTLRLWCWTPGARPRSDAACSSLVARLSAGGD